MKKIIFLGTLIILVLAGFLLWYSRGSEELQVTITNFDECVAAGNVIMESYPRQCRTKDDKLFIEDIGNELDKIDLIRIDNPRPNELIESPLDVEGEARGYWFFEGDFPVKLLDGNDQELWVGYATALSDWMTEGFVPFEAELEFEAVTTKKGLLILEKDNPSGLPENADQLEVPIHFK